MSIDPGVIIGHVHLKVSDLDRALGFYCGVLGFDLIPGVRRAFAKHTMGLAGRLPRLSRGVPLE